MAKKNFEIRLAGKIKVDNKSFYAYVNSKRICKDKIGPLKDDLGNLVLATNKMGKMLNEYFASVFNKDEVTEGIDLNMDAIVGDSVVLENVEITLEKVYRAVSSLKRNKKEGVDGLNSTIFIECKSGVSLPLQKVFSSSIKNGDIPADWKMANVTPIFKKGSKKDMGNYRPVSLTCQACKICEKILKEEIVNFLEINNRLANSQHGFRNKRSCLTNLLEFTERILEHVDGNEPVDVIFLIYKKRSIRSLIKDFCINCIKLVLEEGY